MRLVEEVERSRDMAFDYYYLWAALESLGWKIAIGPSRFLNSLTGLIDLSASDCRI